MWVPEDELSKTLLENVCFAVKYIQNMSFSKELHQLNIMDNTLLHRIQRHFCTLTHIKGEVMALPYRPMEVRNTEVLI